MMANPFLMADLEPEPPAAGMNPFLSGGETDIPPTTGDNPFMSALSNGFQSSVNTNPFAFGATDTATDAGDFFTSAGPVVNFCDIFASQPVQPQPQPQPPPAAPQTDVFTTGRRPPPPKPAPPANIFVQPRPAPVTDLFDSFVEPVPAAIDHQLIPERPSQPPVRSTVDIGDLLDTGTVTDSSTVNLMDDILGEELQPAVVPCTQAVPASAAGPPMRPPPPRPPPSRETKELILSVTGAMEATSSDLLDRLQATRTPSPTPIRELHSPSPTPDMMQVTDLLDVGMEPELLGSEDVLSSTIDAQQQQQQTDGTSSVLSMTPSPEPESVIEAVRPLPPRPTPPAVPERPKVPPAKPPPPQYAIHAPVVAETIPDHILAQFDDRQTQSQVANTVSPIIDTTKNIFDLDTSESILQQIPQDNNNLQFFDVDGTSTSESNANVEQSLFFDTTVNEISVTETPARQSEPATSEGDLSLFSTTIDRQEPVLPAEPSVDFFSTTIQPDAYSLDLQQATPFQNDATSNVFDIGIGSQGAAVRSPAVNEPDAFDAFAAKFENAGSSQQSSDPFDPFSGSSAFGDAAPHQPGGGDVGFGADESFDAFLALREEGPPPVPQSTPARVSRGDSRDSEDGNEFNIFIKPKSANSADVAAGAVTPIIAPPPKSPMQDSSPRFNPFDKSQDISGAAPDNFFASADMPSGVQPVTQEDIQATRPMERTESQETPPTPLFDEDVSQPLEEFPRIHYSGLGWEMLLRQPNKKKITGQRFWKKVFIRLVYQGENPVLQLFNNKDDKDPFQELPLQPCYSVSEIGAQQYDQFGKIFTVKLQFIFYKERPGVRPGQVTKAERLTNKLSQFAAYAIQGDYQGVKEFGSDLKKLGLPVEHAPQISQLFKIGSHTYEDMKQFSVTIEEALFRLPAHRDRALNYKMEEVQITAVDELYVEQNRNGGITRQIARVRLFFLGFLSGMPDIELGVNDMVRQGKEVVGRHDIIPVVTEEWIRLENVEFHSCVQQDEYERTRTIKFKPPDSCYIELMRFRVRPPKNRELPLQVKTTMCISGNKVELKSDVLVPGFSSRKLGQIPCEDVMIRFPIPECWIYLFRVEKHFRYGSVKSAHRRSGKIKGIERFLGAVDNLEPSLMEVTSGQAKYEHQHRAIVWRMPRLPKEGQGAYTSHSLVCKMALTSYDQVPDQLAQHCFVEFTMPITQVSHTTVRSVSIANSDSDTPPEKYVRQLARHEYTVEIEHTTAEGPGDYIAATSVSKPIAEEPVAAAAAAVAAPRPPAAAESDSDSSS